ncbi:MAG: osmotically inducible protein OsmC [Ignavibacteria bacterium]|nr:MAG: osmotically inducible protein OsmC [Ignavibacteria bacterium]
MKTAFVTQVAKNGITFAGRTNSNHWITMDGPEKFGGSDAGVRPKELLLLSLAGCTGSDVASILAKKRVALDNLEMNISAEESEEHPIVFTSMHIEYVFYGEGIEAKDVERAIELSQTKYCGVTAMFEKAMKVTHSYRIEAHK